MLFFSFFIGVFLISASVFAAVIVYSKKADEMRKKEMSGNAASILQEIFGVYVVMTACAGVFFVGCYFVIFPFF